MRRFLVALFAFTTLSTTSVFAEPGVTDAVDVTPVIWKGQHVGCQVQFDVLRHDPQYFQNQVVFISGSVSFYVSETPPAGLLLKLGVALVAQNPTYEAPTAGYLIDGFTPNSNELRAQFVGEMPGFRLFSYPFSDRSTSIVMKSLNTGKFEIAYSMNGGSTGAQFVADLTTKPEQYKKWVTCVGSLADSVPG